MTEDVMYHSEACSKEIHKYGKEIYKYDAAGNMTEKVWYYSDGTQGSKETYKYDDKGNMTEEAKYKSDGSLNFKHIYKYDDVGNVTGWTEYEGDIMTPIREVEWIIVYRNN